MKLAFFQINCIQRNLDKSGHSGVRKSESELYCNSDLDILDKPSGVVGIFYFEA